jgi:hypothetical protein
MGVIAQLADEMEQESREVRERAPGPGAVQRMQVLLAVGAYMLRRMQEQQDQTDELLMRPPRIINFDPPGTPI